MALINEYRRAHPSVASRCPAIRRRRRYLAVVELYRLKARLAGRADRHSPRSTMSRISSRQFQASWSSGSSSKYCLAAFRLGIIVFDAISRSSSTKGTS